MSALSEELRGKIRKYTIQPEELEMAGWRFIGCNKKNIIYNHHNFTVPQDVKIPYRRERCICKVRIEDQCYIYHIDTHEVEVLGNECIKKCFPKDVKKRCERCGVPHKNRKDNFCKGCREVRLYEKLVEEERIEEIKRVEEENSRKICRAFSFVMKFGKYSTRTLSDIYKMDKKYLDWILKTFDSEKGGNRSDNKTLIESINIVKNNWDSSPLWVERSERGGKETPVLKLSDYQQGLLNLWPNPPRGMSLDDHIKGMLGDRRYRRDTIAKARIPFGMYQGISIEEARENGYGSNYIDDAAFEKCKVCEGASQYDRSICQKFKKIAYQYIQDECS